MELPDTTGTSSTHTDVPFALSTVKCDNMHDTVNISADDGDAQQVRYRIRIQTVVSLKTSVSKYT